MNDVDKKLEEWQGRWDNGDAKFVPELFEQFEQLQRDNQHLSQSNLRRRQERERYKKALEEVSQELGRQSGTYDTPKRITLEGAYEVYKIAKQALEDRS
jgi:hypothetical protein